MEDPAHPSLRFKKLAGYENVWSVRIGAQYRAVGERTGGTIVWAWIGSHNDFDKLFGSVEEHDLFTHAAPHPDQSSQFSILSPGTCAKSWILRVSSVASYARAMDAIFKS